MWLAVIFSVGKVTEIVTGKVTAKVASKAIDKQQQSAVYDDNTRKTS